LFYLAALPLGFTAAALSATGLVMSPSFILLGNSLNSEIPWLLLVGLSLVLFDSLRRHRDWKSAMAWAFVNGTACLFRAEHVLYFGLMTAFLIVSGKAGKERRAALVAICLAF